MQWFTNPTDSQEDDASQFFRVEHKFDRDGKRVGDVVDMESIIQPCPLTPWYGQKADDLVSNKEINGENCLEECNKFWINSFHDQLAYQTLW